MALQALNTLIRKAKAFLPDKGERAILDNSQILLEFGRLVIEKALNGRIRLKIGDGNKKYIDQNYIGEAIVIRTDPTTVSVGALPAGSVLTDESFTDVLDKIAYAYQNVLLNSISVNQSNLELGQALNNSIILSSNISNIANLQNGNSALVYSSPNIFTAQQFDPRLQYTITGVNGTFNVVTDIVITVDITGKNGEVSSKSRTIQVSPRMWWGSSALTDITNYTELKALINNRLDRDRFGDYTFVNNYSHIGFPTQFNITGIGFVDLDINTNEELFGYAMDTKSQLTIINDYGIQIIYNMYRSTFPFAGITKFKVK